MKKVESKKTPSKFKLWREKMKSTTKGRAYLKLIYWAIFFGVLFIFLFIASMINNNNLRDTNSPSNEEEVENTLETPQDVVEEKSIEELFQDLLTTNYDYEYNITVDNTHLLFDGTKYDTYEEGYKTEGDSIIRYYIDETGTYQVNGEERLPQADFYLGLDSSLLDLENLFNTMNALGFNKTSNGYTTNDTTYTYTVNTLNEAITSIIIENTLGTIRYELNFEVNRNA